MSPSIFFDAPVLSHGSQSRVYPRGGHVHRTHHHIVRDTIPMLRYVLRSVLVAQLGHDPTSTVPLLERHLASHQRVKSVQRRFEPCKREAYTSERTCKACQRHQERQVGNAHHRARPERKMVLSSRQGPGNPNKSHAHSYQRPREPSPVSAMQFHGYNRTPTCRIATRSTLSNQARLSPAPVSIAPRQLARNSSQRKCEMRPGAVTAAKKLAP